MEKLLDGIVQFFAKIHSYIMSLNDQFEHSLSDKMLHFIVIGIVGLFLVLVVHPIFKALAKRGHVMVITWVYVFTLIIVLTFAIEIGQNMSGTGNMEFADIEFGVVGFMAFFIFAMLIRHIWHMCCRIYVRRKKRKLSAKTGNCKDEVSYDNYYEVDNSEEY